MTKRPSPCNDPLSCSSILGYVERKRARTSRACDQCRILHRACSSKEGSSTCSRCERLGRECTWNSSYERTAKTISSYSLRPKKEESNSDRDKDESEEGKKITVFDDLKVKPPTSPSVVLSNECQKVATQHNLLLVAFSLEPCSELSTTSHYTYPLSYYFPPTYDGNLVTSKPISFLKCLLGTFPDEQPILTPPPPPLPPLTPSFSTYTWLDEICSPLNQPSFDPTKLEPNLYLNQPFPNSIIHEQDIFSSKFDPELIPTTPFLNKELGCFSPTTQEPNVSEMDENWKAIRELMDQGIEFL